MSTITICCTCRHAPAAVGIKECVECCASHEPVLSLALRNYRIGLPFRTARSVAVRQFVAKASRAA